MPTPSQTTPLLLPQAAQRVSTPGRGTGGLSPELLSESARRLRVLALLYAFTFFMAGFLPALLFAQDRAPDVPGSGELGTRRSSIAVAFWCGRFLGTRVPLPVVMNVGLGFEVVSSYGIALAEYLEPTRLNINGWIGLSWVAVWTLLFTVVIPTRPGKAMLVTLASVTSVPVVIGFMVLTRRTTFSPDPLHVLLLDRVSVSADRRSWPMSVRASSTRSARRSPKRASSEAIGSSSASGRAAWARCGGRSIACWRARRRSS